MEILFFKKTHNKINFNVNKVIKTRYRPEIEGLRAFAIVAVIINHFNKEIMPSGFLGVDIFFPILKYKNLFLEYQIYINKKFY